MHNLCARGAVELLKKLRNEAKTVTGKLGTLFRKGPDGPILFGQVSVGKVFTKPSKRNTFEFACKSIDEVARGLRNGDLQPHQIPVKFDSIGGQRVAVNNRSLTAFRRAGIEPTRVIDITSNLRELNKVLGRLDTKKMGGVPSSTIRIRGSGIRDTSSIR